MTSFVNNAVKATVYPWRQLDCMTSFGQIRDTILLEPPRQNDNNNDDNNIGKNLALDVENDKENLKRRNQL